MSNNMLFLVCTLIWGTTWIAITFMHSEMSLVYSVGFRFLIAAVLLGCWCVVKRLNMRFSGSQHLRMILAGLFLYTLDYGLLYQAQQYIVSALLAVMSVSVVYFNVVLRKVMYNKPIRLEVVLGAFVSLMGLALLFGPEVAGMEADDLLQLGLLLATLSFFFAALANVMSENIMESGVPVIQFNFYAMSYSLLFTLGFAAATEEPLIFPQHPEYWVALLYLAVFGTVLAFGAYMKLVINIGADKAANVILLYPVVALIVSTLFEGYQWTLAAFSGVIVVLTGNAIAMDKLTLTGLSRARNCALQQIKRRA